MTSPLNRVNEILALDQPRSPNLIATIFKVKRSPESGRIGSGDRYRIIIVTQTKYRSYARRRHRSATWFFSRACFLELSMIVC
ncbi:MAG: hypothetical protein V7L31_27480 [Nostoc sp.]|uniref:hypothetical protein n=1 Tax=Nostoc sp. TaxID=1180 RepID=UPI002FEE67F1